MENDMKAPASIQNRIDPDECEGTEPYLISESELITLWEICNFQKSE